MIKERQM